MVGTLAAVLAASDAAADAVAEVEGASPRRHTLRRGADTLSPSKSGPILSKSSQNVLTVGGAIRWRAMHASAARTLLGAAAPSEGEYDATYAVVDGDFDTTETYRVTLIFLGFVVLSLLVEKGLHWLEHSLSSSGRKGLVGALHHLQSEVRETKMGVTGTPVLLWSTAFGRLRRFLDIDLGFSESNRDGSN